MIEGPERAPKEALLPTYYTKRSQVTPRPRPVSPDPDRTRAPAAASSRSIGRQMIGISYRCFLRPTGV